MPFLKFTHIALIVAAAVLVWATDLLFYQAARRGDVRGLVTIARYGRTLIPIGVVVFFAGLGVGFLNAIVGGFNLLAPWLLLAYGLVVAMMILGALVETPILERMAKRAEEEADAGAAEPSPELRAMLSDRRPLVLLAISALLWIAVIYVMVVKPLT